MPQDRYRRTAGGVSNLHLHLVWCPKYRRPVLVGPVADRLRDLLREKAEALDTEVKGLEVMPDHVHLFITVPPVNAPQFYANQFKGYTSRVLRQEFPHLKSALPSLWSRSYYVGSAGTVTEATIRRYIASQRERR
jgi:putative transposase